MDQLSIYLPGIILAYSAFLLAMLSPGPNILSVMGVSMGVDRRCGIALALGIGTGTFFWSVLTVVGLSALLAAYASALIFIKIAGGLYLLWLAFKAFRAAAVSHDIYAEAPTGGKRRLSGYYLQGLLIQMTNPKAILAWIAIVSLGLQADAPLWVGLAIIIGTSILSIALHCAYAVAFSTPAMVRIYSNSRRWIQGALGTFFTFAGIKLLTDR